MMHLHTWVEGQLLRHLSGWIVRVLRNHPGSGGLGIVEYINGPQRGVETCVSKDVVSPIIEER